MNVFNSIQSLTTVWTTDHQRPLQLFMSTSRRARSFFDANVFESDLSASALTNQRRGFLALGVEDLAST